MTASKKPKNKEQKKSPAQPGVFLLLRETILIYKSYSQIFFGYTAWLLIPIIISVLARTTFDPETFSFVDIFFNLTLYFVISIFITVIFVKIVPNLHKGNPVPTKLIKDASILTVPFLLAALLTSLIVFSGLILVIVPGIIFSIWFAFTATIVVIEQKPIFVSLKMSRELVRGRFLSVLWRYYAGILLIWSIQLLLIFAVVYLSFSTRGVDPMEFITSTPTLSEDVLIQLVDILFLPVIPIYTTLLYVHLKNR